MPYFTPEHHPFTPIPNLGDRRQVVVVGAGPVGMAVALGLARRGVSVTVLEAGGTVSFGSRAICMSRHSIEILDRLSVGSRVTQVSLPWTRGRSFFRDREVLVFSMPQTAQDVRSPMINISQSVLEQIMVEEIASTPGCFVHWHAAVTGVRQESQECVVSVDTPDGPLDVRAEWVVATDGARSAVRDSLGLKLNGTSYEGIYVIADIHWPVDLPTERRVWFDAVSNPGSTIIMHRQPDDIWRVDYQLVPGEDPAVESTPERMTERITNHLAWLGLDTPWTLEWWSMYRARAVSLDEYAHGRVLFAGDAAHLVPIFGVRGLNSGLEDADTLAWQLALVANDVASPDLLRTYSFERRDAWRQNVESADKSTQFMTPSSYGSTASRDAVLSLADDYEQLRVLVNPRQSSACHARRSPITWQRNPDAQGLQPGDPIADRRVVQLRPEGRRETTLDALRGLGFAVLGFDVDERVLIDLCRRADAVLGGAGSVTPLQVTLSASRRPAQFGVTTIDDSAADLRSALGCALGQAVVIRPDGLLLARLSGINEAESALRSVVRPEAPSQRAYELRGRATPATDPALVQMEDLWRTVGHAIDDMPVADRERRLTELVLALAVNSGGGADAVRAALAGRR